MSTVILFNNINKFTAMSNMNGSWFYWNSECKVMAVFFSSLGRNFSPWWWFGKKINLCFRKMPRTNLILIANFKSANVLRARVWKCVVSFSCLRKTKEKELVDSRFFFLISFYIKAWFQVQRLQNCLYYCTNNFGTIVLRSNDRYRSSSLLSTKSQASKYLSRND